MLPNKEVIHQFDFGKKRYAFKFFLQPSLYQYFSQQPKAYAAGVSNWETHYWNMFILDDADKVWMDDFLSKLGKITTDHEEKVLIATNYVQMGLPYDWGRYQKANGMQYPYETVFRGTGLCGDKTLLLTKILCQLGYDVVMLTYDKANHMALAIKVPPGYGNFTQNNSTYAFIESTSCSQIGHIPERFVGGIQLTEKPNFIFPKKNGLRTFHRIVELKKQEAQWVAKYGKEYLSANAYEKVLLEEMYLLDEEMKRLNKEENTPKSLLQQAINIFVPYNDYSKVNEFNSLVLLWHSGFLLRCRAKLQLGLIQN